MVAFTDAILAGGTLFMAGILFSRANGRRPVVLWAWAFVCTAIAALAGVYYHVCRLNLSLGATQIAWKVVPFSSGLAMFFFGWAAAVAWLRPAVLRVALALLALDIGACLFWAIFSNSFLIVIAESLPVLVALWALSERHSQNPASQWIAPGVFTSVLAAIAQATSLLGSDTLRGFDPNVAFHLIQLVANYFFFRGGLLLEELRDE